MSETYFVKKPRKEKFTIIDNTCIKDCNLSWKAKGVHTFLMTLPENWKIFITELVQHSVDGKSSLYSAIKELEKHGYIKKSQGRKPDGSFSNIVYVIYEKPQQVSNEPLTDFPNADNPDTEKPKTENQQLLNTNKLIINKLTTKLTNSSSNETETEQSVSESVLVKKIKKLFNDTYPFDKNFEEEVQKQLSEYKIDLSNLEEYLEYVFERTKISKVKKSFEGLYHKLALSSSILRDFTISIKDSKINDRTEITIPEIDCPICSTRFSVYEYCPTCGATIREIENQDLPDFKARKKIYHMTESEKQAYELDLEKRGQDIADKTGHKIMSHEETIIFWKDYGLLD